MSTQVVNLIRSLSPPPVLIPPSAPFGLTLFVDVIDGAFSDVATTHFDHAVLYKNGAEIKIIDFTYQESEQGLGNTAQVTLLTSDYNQILSTDLLDFDLGKSATASGSIGWVRKIANGKLAGRSRTMDANTIGRVTVTIVDQLADRWNKAPTRPQIYYNPALTSAPPTVDAAHAPVTVDGVAILPIITSYTGLSLYAALNLAYVTGLGFNTATIDDADYPISALEFTLENGYDGGVRPLISWAQPDFEIVGNDLRIKISSDNVPSGITPRAVFISGALRLSQSQAAAEKVGQVAISYQSREGEIYSERDLPAVVTGNGIAFGDPGFSEQTVITRLGEWKQVSPSGTIGAVVKSEVKRITTTTRGNYASVTGEEIENISFNGEGLRSGHTKTVSKQMPTVETGDFELTSVYDEINQTTYIRNPFNPAEYVQERSRTDQSGLVLIEPDIQYFDLSTGEKRDKQTPLTEAHINGYIKGDGSQTYEYLPIRTDTNEIRIDSASQLTWQRKIFNYCSNVEESSTTQTVPGSSALGIGKTANQRTVYLGTPNGYRTVSFNAGELPYTLAIEAGNRYLLERQTPPQTVELDLAMVDLLTKKGTFITPHDRAGALAPYRVASVKISGSSQSPRFSMSVTAKEMRGEVRNQLSPNRVSSGYQFRIAESSNYTFPLVLSCYSGFQLRAQTNAVVTVSARRTGSGDAFQNIQTAPLDLTAYDSRKVSFDIKLTAAAISDFVEHERINLTVEPI